MNDDVRGAGLPAVLERSGLSFALRRFDWRAKRARGPGPRRDLPRCADELEHLSRVMADTVVQIGSGDGARHWASRVRLFERDEA